MNDLEDLLLLREVDGNAHIINLFLSRCSVSACMECKQILNIEVYQSTRYIQKSGWNRCPFCGLSAHITCVNRKKLCGYCKSIKAICTDCCFETSKPYMDFRGHIAYSCELNGKKCCVARCHRSIPDVGVPSCSECASKIIKYQRVFSKAILLIILSY